MERNLLTSESQFFFISRRREVLKNKNDPLCILHDGMSDVDYRYCEY